MKKSDIIRAWRDPEYRASLSEAGMPGEIEPPGL